VLTRRQFELLKFIHQYLQEHGTPPSFEEMRAALGLRSKSGIHRLISGLEERGFIRRLAYRARALEVLKPPPQPAGGSRPAARATPALPAPVVGSNVVRAEFRPPRRAGLLAGVTGNVDLPVYGRITAGTPIEALADHGTTMDVPAALLGEGEHYILQVVGDSMIEAGIQDGDWVVIRRTETAESGDIVVALIDDREVTLKRLRKRGASIALEAANPAYETRIFGPNQVKVQGKLVGLLRRY
jgi:repressor LexA